MLIGSCSRVVAGRSAVQTVYWRMKNVDGQTKIIKSCKSFTPAAKEFNPPQSRTNGAITSPPRTLI